MSFGDAMGAVLVWTLGSIFFGGIAIAIITSWYSVLTKSDEASDDAQITVGISVLVMVFLIVSGIVYFVSNLV